MEYKYVEKIILNGLYRSNIVKDGHFLLTSGRHAKNYIHKDMIFSHAPVELFSRIIRVFTRICYNLDIYFDLITGPAVAGAILAVPVAMNTFVNFVYPEKIAPDLKLETPEKMIFSRGFDKVIKDKRVLIIEDVITTGGSVNRTIDAIEECKGDCVGVVCLWKRTNWKSEKFPVVSIINKFVPSWLPKECPLCKDNMPLTNPKVEL